MDHIVITFEQLRAFQAIVSHGTFRAAAEALNKSQPAVSSTIRNLEGECGFPLFSRERYRPELTREGRVFYDRAVAALREMGRLSALAGRLSGAEEPVVEIAVNAIYPLGGLLGVLRDVEANFPVTQFTLSTEMLGGAMERLATGEIDIALTTDIDYRPETMELLPFDQVRIIPVAHRDYAPAGNGQFNTADDMRSFVQVLVADSSAGPNRQSLDVLPEVRHWVVSDVAAKKDIILAGMGWGGLPEHVVADELKSGVLVRIHVEGFEIRTSQLYIIRRTDRPAGIVAEALWQALRSAGADQADDRGGRT